MKKRLFSIITALALCLSLLPATALAASNVTYLDWDSNANVLVSKNCPSATEVTRSDTQWGTAGTETWYVVNGDVTITNSDSDSDSDSDSISDSGSDSVTVIGDVHLILADNCTFTVNGGIQGESGASLTIYAQSNDTSMGKLIATGGNPASGDSCGIYADSITINGGDITATGGVANGDDSMSCGISADNGGITINGGTVNATGGTVIGLTTSESYHGHGTTVGIYTERGDLNVNGGTVTAAGADNTAWSFGVFVDGYWDDQESKSYAYDLNVTGGTVRATGGAASYTGGQTFAWSAGMNVSNTLTISDGIVTTNGNNAYGGDSKTYGIDAGQVIINGGEVTAAGMDALRSYGIMSYMPMTVSGGTVTATGNTATGTNSESYGICAVGDYDDDGQSVVDSVTISDGTVTATGGAAGSASFGIGAYIYKGNELSDGTITIEGGEVIAQTLATAGTHGALSVVPTLPDVYWWCTAADAEAFTASTTTAYSDNADHTYVEITDHFTVALDPNGGTVDPTSVTTGADGKLASLPTPTRDGYTFDGWYTAADGGENVTTDTVFTGNTTIYAHWTINTYTVTLNPNDDTVEPSSVTTGANGKLASLPTPTRSGYIFVGWFTAVTGGDRVTVDTVFNGDATIYAHWTAVSYGGGSSSGGGSNTTTTTEKNEDGSTTTTVTDKTTGTVTETTKNTDGSTTVVETKKDGTVTETKTTADGTTGTVVTDKDGSVTGVKATVSAIAATEAAKTGGAVTLPVEVPSATNTADAPAAEITMPVSSGSVKVEIPVETVTPGTVAVIVKADGTEEIVKTSIPTESGVALALTGSSTVKVVDNSKVYSDVQLVNHWASDAVDFVSARELFTGTSASTYNPNGNTNRAMLMTVLARLDDVDTTGGTNWYEKGLNWAVEKGISDGTNPEDLITREQVTVMLWRYAGSPESSHSLENYTDADQISTYAQEAMCWANENGIINGYGNGLLGAKDNASRAETSQMLMNYVKALRR